MSGLFQDSPVAIVAYSYRMPGGISTDSDFWQTIVVSARSSGNPSLTGMAEDIVRLVNFLARDVLPVPMKASFARMARS